MYLGEVLVLVPLRIREQFEELLVGDPAIPREFDEVHPEGFP